MYRTLIVDDEPLMRTYLANNTAAICPYFAVTGVACDGREAMELLQKQNFDLVITDIRMPEMDGIGLAKYISEAFPHIKIIILSGYNEFEYARSALKYHVTDYLLKPLNDNALADVLMNVKEQLAADSRHNASLTVFPENINPEELGSLFLSAVLEEDPGQMYSLYDKLMEHGLFSEGQLFCIMLIYPDGPDLLLSGNTAPDMTAWQLKLWKLCQDYCRPRHLLSAKSNDGDIYLLLAASDEAHLHKLASHVFQELTNAATAFHFPRLLASCGQISSDLSEFSYSAKTAYAAAALSLLNKKPPFSQEQYLENKEIILQIQETCAILYQDYLSSSREKLMVDFPLYTAFFRDAPSAAALLQYGTYLLHYICSRSHIKLHYKKAAYEALFTAVDRLLPTGNFTEPLLTDALHGSICALLSPDKPARISESQQIAENARKYILSHYQEQISLSQIAEEIGVNSCYLSDIFHKYMGEPYSRYLLRIRMEQAARLLKENPGEKVYKIAERTGFVSSKHFIAVFKKYYGTTPSAYVSR